MPVGSAGILRLGLCVVIARPRLNVCDKTINVKDIDLQIKKHKTRCFSLL